MKGAGHGAGEAHRRIEELALSTSEDHCSANVALDKAHSTSEPRTFAEWLSPLPLAEGEAPGPAPSAAATRASDKGFLPMPLADYLDLLDWTGRQAVRGKRGVVPAHLAPILERLDIPNDAWLELSLGFGKLFHRVAGCPRSVAAESARARRRFRAPGARLLRPSRVQRE